MPRQSEIEKSVQYRNESLYAKMFLKDGAVFTEDSFKKAFGIEKVYFPKDTTEASRFNYLEQAAISLCLFSELMGVQPEQLGCSLLYPTALGLQLCADPEMFEDTVLPNRESFIYAPATEHGEFDKDAFVEEFLTTMLTRVRAFANWTIEEKGSVHIWQNTSKKDREELVAGAERLKRKCDGFEHSFLFQPVTVNSVVQSTSQRSGSLLSTVADHLAKPFKKAIFEYLQRGGDISYDLWDKYEASLDRKLTVAISRACVIYENYFIERDLDKIVDSGLKGFEAIEALKDKECSDRCKFMILGGIITSEIRKTIQSNFPEIALETRLDDLPPTLMAATVMLAKNIHTNSEANYLSAHGKKHYYMSFDPRLEPPPASRLGIDGAKPSVSAFKNYAYDKLVVEGKVEQHWYQFITSPLCDDNKDMPEREWISRQCENMCKEIGTYTQVIDNIFNPENKDQNEQKEEPAPETSSMSM